MNFTRENLVQIWGVLNSLAQEKTTAKGAYGIAKNKRIIETEVKSIEEAQRNQKLPDGIEDFEAKRIDLCKEYCDKDKDGKPMVDGNSFVIIENQVVFTEKLTELREEFAEPLQARKDQDKDFREFLKEDVEIDLHKIKIDDMPNNITGQQIEILDDIIVE